MIAEEFRWRVDQWLDGDLAPEDEIRLQMELESTPEGVKYLGDRALLHQMLSNAVSTGIISRDSKLAVARSGWFGSRSTIVGVSLVVIAGILLVSILSLPHSMASPAGLVQQVLDDFESARDRVYAVRIELENGRRRSSVRRRNHTASSTLWVRGNRFVQIYPSDSEPMIWGRDFRGAVWFVVAGRSAVIFDADEVPEILQEVCELRTLDLPTLLDSLLHDFDLEFSERKQRVDTIVALRRPDARDAKYGRVEIDIERESLLVTNVSLERVNFGRPVATITFALEQMMTCEDAYYDLATHLAPDAQIFDRDAPRGQRSELLREFLREIRVASIAEIESTLRVPR